MDGHEWNLYKALFCFATKLLLVDSVFVFNTPKHLVYLISCTLYFYAFELYTVY